MEKVAGRKQSARMSDAAVRAKTGKTWPEWFSILDEGDATKMGHRDIVAYLCEKHGVGDWWGQMVTVVYEQERGLRELHQKPEGFEIGVSKTLAVPATTLFEAWQDERERGQWLPEMALVIRKATPDKSLRISFPDGKTSVDVDLYPKGEGRCQITVRHTKLPSGEEADRMKAFWAAALGRLKDLVEAKRSTMSPVPRG